MKTLTTTLTAAGLAFGLGASAFAADRLVPQEYPTIQAAIDAAVAGDVVLVADGTYTGDGNRDISFQGKAITVRSENGPKACVIDCDGTQTEPYRGFHFGTAETRDSILDGFTICNGSTLPGAVADQFNGGAILCNNSASPTIRNCIMRDNWAGCWGAAVSCGWDPEAHPLIENCVIVNNYSDDDGGALFAVGASATVVNSIIAGNEARVSGGAIGNFGGGTFHVKNSTIANNTAPWGGAVYDWQANISNSILYGNTGDNQILNVGPGQITYSNVEGGFVGVGNVDVDPMFVDAIAGDYRLADGSPMIDAGDPDYVAETGEADSQGDPRILRAGLDIGGDEYRPLGDVDADGYVGITDLLEMLALWGPCANCDADVNNDNQVNIQDLLMTLGNWGI